MAETMTSKAARKRTDRSVITDPDELFRRTAECCREWNFWSEQQGLGVRFVSMPRQFLIQQSRPGAVEDAKKNDWGCVGRVLRRLDLDGCFSKSQQVLDAVEAKVQLERNRRIKAARRSVRNLKVGKEILARLDREERRRLNRIRRVKRLVESGNEFLDDRWPVEWRAYTGDDSATRVIPVPVRLERRVYHRSD